ncbi:MAG: Na+/H+ antiporter NhaC family protein [Bacteroidales bacterium]|nr:Na+/H+ antiporter NhaC family protein [Bacteroidales bacterium]
MRYFINYLYILICLLFLYNNGFSENINKLPDTTLNSIQDFYEVRLPDIIIKDIKSNIKIVCKDSLSKNEEIKIKINNIPQKIKFINGTANLDYEFTTKEKINISIGYFYFEKQINPIPLWLSILPPLLAILIALIFKEVFSALFIGLFSGTSIIFYYKESSIFLAIFKGIFAIPDTYIIGSLNDTGHLSIIVFSLLIGAMVNLITKNGGMKGVVNILVKYANTARSGQFITWLLGIFIFFDDYANTLVVGNTMRPVTDKLKISREKLAYIVDSTAAPVAALALITTWIGIELSYIQDGINAIGLDKSAYSVFISSLNTRFYPIFTLIFILLLIWKKRDFGPMLQAEKKAKSIGQIQSINNNDNLSDKFSEITISDTIKAKWYNAVIPVFIIIAGTIVGLFYTGWDSNVWNDETYSFMKKLSYIVGRSDSYKALLWSSFFSVLVAVFLTTSQKILSLKQSIDSLMNGIKTMLVAVLILVFAWSLAQITQDLHTADFITNILIYTKISPQLLPAITFIISALIAFSTGSSWGTMAILYPLILPASWLICAESGFEHVESVSIFYNVVSCVLAGSVLGDHCSPISDTTILSSLASSCNHIKHVKTQMPYALVVGFVSVIIGTIPSAYGISSWILFPLGIIIMYLIIIVFGKKAKVLDL